MELLVVPSSVRTLRTVDFSHWCSGADLMASTQKDARAVAWRGVAWRGRVGSSNSSNPRGVQSEQRWSGVAWALSRAWNGLELR